MSKDNQALWSYIINYSPDGEENYAYVYTPDGEFVGNLKIHHARAIVGGLNEAAQLSTLQERAERAEAREKEWRRAWDEDDRDTRYFSKCMTAQSRALAAEARVAELLDQINSLEDGLEYYKRFVL